MRRPLLVALLVMSGCANDEEPADDGLFDPAAPSASGAVDLGPNASSDGYTVLVIRFEPVGTGDRIITDAIPLPATFPLPFGIGGGIGSATATTYALRLWLDTDSGAVAPPVGAPHVETTVMSYCTSSGSCGGEYDLALTLAP